MENPNSKFRWGATLFFFGLFVGLVPGQIKIDALRREMHAEREDAAQVNAGLKADIADATNKLNGIQVDRNECAREAGADGSETVIVTQNHPYAGWQQNIRGVTLTVPVPSYPPMVSPVIVVRGLVRPNTLDGVGGVVYTHLYPDGHIDGWRQPGRAE